LGWLRFIPEEQTPSTWGASCLQTLARQKGFCILSSLLCGRSLHRSQQ
jgi:hypothetical protein